MAERLTWEACTQDVDRLHFGPVEDGEVAQVRDAGKTCPQYPVAVLVDLGVPRDGRSVVGGDSQVQSAVAGAETSEPRHRQHAADSFQ